MVGSCSHLELGMSVIVVLLSLHVLYLLLMSQNGLHVWGLWSSVLLAVIGQWEVILSVSLSSVSVCCVVSLNLGKFALVSLLLPVASPGSLQVFSFILLSISLEFRIMQIMESLNTL